ncbi:MAG: hypothetical protein KIT46_03595 [Anaerolineales bacterium]|nr:hypothetical protein [Anaerolineales bacterium]MCW5855109.1 hypothetical protein [Anaerolineales bacterium]
MSIDWLFVLLAAGLLPVLLFLALVFLVLGYSGRLGWVIVREVHRRSAVVTGYLCLILAIVTVSGLMALFPLMEESQELAMSQVPSDTPIIAPTEPIIVNTPTVTLDPLSLVLGTSVDLLSTSAVDVTPTPTQMSLDASRECGLEFNPPCTYTLRGETSVLAVARSVTGQDALAAEYAGLIRTLLRDNYGYIGPLTAQMRVPDLAIPLDVEFFRFHFSDAGWDVCLEPPTVVPCLYQVEDDFVVLDQERAYQAIAFELFPRVSNAAKCIREANTYLHKGGNVYVPIEIQPGITLIIPDISAPGRESCRN